ncbi:hypothetical protein DFH11DRAFT_972159 [Phellopilus nigrolimitatus]|nr:hypothetical protein DFH11DRAFT_972159 [Phellopilus nigrolimitatus]
MCLANLVRRSMSPVHIVQTVAFLNNGEHIIYGSYTNDHDVLKNFSVGPGGSTNLFIIEEAEDCRNSDFSWGRTYPVTLQRGRHKRYVTYPPEDGASVVEMNAQFEAPAPLTFVNTGTDIVAVSYTNSRGGTTAFHLAPDNQEQADNFSSREGAYKAVTLQRGADKEHMECVRPPLYMQPLAEVSLISDKACQQPRRWRRRRRQRPSRLLHARQQGRRHHRLRVHRRRRRPGPGFCPPARPDGPQNRGARRHGLQRAALQGHESVSVRPLSCVLLPLFIYLFYFTSYASSPAPK